MRKYAAFIVSIAVFIFGCADGRAEDQYSMLRRAVYSRWNPPANAQVVRGELAIDVNGQVVDYKFTNGVDPQTQQSLVAAISQSLPLTMYAPDATDSLNGIVRVGVEFDPKSARGRLSISSGNALSKPGLNLVFPKGISPIYAQEPEGKARMHTCVDQYNANKAINASGGLKWIEETGGGYYSVCNERLKTVNSSPPPPMGTAPINPSVGENRKVPVGGSVTTQECSAKYQASKAAGVLNGRRWNDFRREECNAEAAAGDSIPESNGSSLAAAPAAGGQQGRLGLSFDCATAKSTSARLICSDDALTDATQRLGYVYANAKDRGGDPEGTTRAQLAWIKERNTRCGLDNKSNALTEVLALAKPCMLEAINGRIAEFGGSVGAPTAGAVVQTAPSAKISQTLSSEEVDAFRKFMASWAPPAGSPAIDVHFRLKRDGTIDGTPEVISTGAGSTFEVAKNEAVRTVLQAQPFKMFRPESYDAWKDIVVTFEAPAVPIAEEARDRQRACVAKYDSAKTAGEVGDISRENFLKVCALTGTPVIPAAKK
jgi:uncharacterized protein YecT (DUF1311 family)